ncbi:MAG: ComEC/Rec2 family competence protein [Candidatus Nomurabacteria bacterium]|nr:MAG: ComEC/Rec2 family competence protein [Candidatus Nomurabacteria bacterium]
MQARLFYTSLLACTLGVGLQTVHAFSAAAIMWLLLAAFVIAVVWRRRSFAPSAPYLLLVSIAFFATALGMMRMHLASEQFNRSPLASSLGEVVKITGVVVSEPTYSNRTQQLYVQTETDKILVSTDRFQSIVYGDVLTITGMLEQPAAFTTELGREFDYAGYLKARGVEYRVAFAEVDVSGEVAGNGLIRTLLAAKHWFMQSLERFIPDPSVGLGEGLLLGVKSALGDEIESDFRRTGIVHIVVLSGYNVMLVVSFIILCFSYFFPRTWRIVFAIVAIVLFALIVGLSATVVRASVMASLVLFAELLGRRYNVLRALLFAGVVMLIINPYLLLYDIGFQLSFMATLGLVLILPHFETVLASGGMLGIKDFLFSTIATQIAVLPLLMYHIGEVSVISVLVNVLVLPMVPLAMLLTFLTGVLGSLSVHVGVVFGYVATWSLQYILVVAHWFAALPFATLLVPEFSGRVVIAIYVMAIFGYWRLMQPNHVVSLPDVPNIEQSVFFRKN